MIIETDKPKNLIIRNKGVFNNTTDSYNGGTYNSSTYGGEDIKTDLGPMMFSSSYSKSNVLFQKDSIAQMISRNIGVFQAGTTYNASTYNASVYGGEDRLTDLGPQLLSIVYDTTPAPAPPPGAMTGQPYGLLLTILQP